MCGDDDDGVSRRDEYELRSPTAVTFGAAGITLPLCWYKTNCLITEAQCVCEQLAQSYVKVKRWESKPRPVEFDSGPS